MTERTTAPVVDSGTMDADNPWPGLAAFREADQSYFQGRDASIDGLMRLVLRAPLTVLHGVSGLGKTSILRAGLFPRLRKERVLPIYVRLSHADESAALVDQVWDATAQAAEDAGVEAPPVPAGFTLWEYFHRKDIRFWDARNRIVTPLLVLDQFEELFTLGRTTAPRRARTDAFLGDLSDLVAGRPAAHVRARLEAAPDEALLFSMTDQPCKVLLSLREDFLPDLAGLRPLMPAVTEHMFRLQPMTSDEALRVVEVGGSLVEADVAARIVQFVASAHGDADMDDDEGHVEPALLSVFCRELNNARRAQGGTRITADLLEGSRTAIIADFYERTISTGDLGAPIRTFVEERLLTESGFRDSVSEEQALRTEGVSQADIDTLIHRRLLRREDAGTKGRARLELTHDVLAEAVRVSRDHRRLREHEARALSEQREREARARREAEEAAARAQERRDFEAAQALAAKEREAAQLAQALAQLERRSRRRQIALLSVLLVATGTLAWFSWSEARRATAAEARANRALSAADVARVTRGEPWALAYLARALRTDPDAPMARGLLIAHLARQVMPLAELTHDATLARASINAASTHVLTVTTGGAVHLWDVRTGTGQPLPTSEAATTAMFSPDGLRVLTAAEDGLVRLWDTETATPIGAGLQHEAPVNAMAFDATGTRIVTGADDQQVRLWTPATNQHTSVRAALDPIVSVSFDATGTRVLSISSEGDAAVWNAGSGTEISRFGVTRNDMEAVIQAAFSPDGTRLLAVLVDGTVRTVETATGRFTGVTLREEGPINAAAFDPTNRRIVTTSLTQGDQASGTIAVTRLWDANTGTPAGAVMTHGDWVSTVGFSTDGTRLVTASHDHTAQVWDARSGAPVGERLTHERPVVSAAFRADGARVLTASEDGTAQIWDADTGRAVGNPLRHDGPVVSAAFGTDGASVLTTGSDGTARVWDARTGTTRETVLRHDDGLLIARAAFNPEGTRVVTSARLDPNLSETERLQRRQEQGVARLWDVATGLPVGAALVHEGSVNAVRFAPAGANRLVTASDDHTARLWDAGTGAAAGAALTHAGPVLAAAFSRDGRRVVTASADGTARVWDAGTGQPVSPPLPHGNEVLSATFSPDGTQVVTGSADGTTRLWDATTGDERPPLHSHDTAVIAVAYTADGTRVVTSSDTYSQIWDVAAGTTVGPRIPHEGAIHPPALDPGSPAMATTSTADEAGVWDIGRAVPAVRWNLRRDDGVVAAGFSRDGRLVTASEDGTARLWNARTRQEVGLPLVHDTAVRWAAFSPDDTRVLTLAADGAARIWDAPTGAPDDQPLLAALAEGLGGHAVDETGGVVRLPDAAAIRADLRNRVAGTSARPDSAVALGQWLFADPRTRTIAPLSAVRRSDELTQAMEATP